MRFENKGQYKGNCAAGWAGFWAKGRLPRAGQRVEGRAEENADGRDGWGRSEDTAGQGT